MSRQAVVGSSGLSGASGVYSPHRLFNASRKELVLLARFWLFTPACFLGGPSTGLLFRFPSAYRPGKLSLNVFFASRANP